MTNHPATTGLSVGATTLAGTRADQAVLHPAALRTDSGTWLSGFVDRIGDPVPLIAGDGTAHQPERLLADALALTAAAVGHPGADAPAAVAVPAHWPSGAVAALRAELPWATTISDADAAVAAMRAAPGLPSDGVLVLCDLGGSGTTISLLDTADDTAIGTTVRYPDFSGDLIDQRILAHLLDGAEPADPAGTAMAGSLARLRAGARLAKHRLSAETATVVALDHAGARLTRAELEQLIDAPLTGFLTALTETLDRFGVRPADVSAVATFGGGARIPRVTESLSALLRVPVITTAHPELTAAAGAALAAQTATAVEAPTALTGLPTAPAPALAWAEDPDVTDFTVSRPRLEFAEPEPVTDEPRRRGPLVAFGVAAAAALAALAAYGLTSFDGERQTPDPVVATVTATATAGSAAPVPAGPARSVSAAPIVVPVAQTPRHRPPAPATAAPSATVRPTPPPTTTTAPPSTTPSTPTSTTQPPTTTPPSTPPTSPQTTTTVPIDPGPGDGETAPPPPIDPGDGTG